jgi:hypothetical protein
MDRRRRMWNLFQVGFLKTHLSKAFLSKYFPILNRCSNSLKCAVNGVYESLTKTKYAARNSSSSKPIICLVRHHDGIIYNTGFHFNLAQSNSNTIFSKQPNTHNLHQQQPHRDIMPTIHVPKATSLKRHSLN